MFAGIFALAIGTGALAGAEGMNLLKNSRFDFHAFAPHREGRRLSHTSHSVAFWNTDAWGDITVQREAVAPADVRPAYAAGNLVRINPGKRFYQFFTLPEASLAHGDLLSLVAGGYQEEEEALAASIRLMKLDSEDGTWSPSDVGLADKREYPRYARGELVVHKAYATAASETGRVTLEINGAQIEGRFEESRESSSAHINTIGIEVEFRNRGRRPVWVWQPCLAKGSAVSMGLPEAREMFPWYTYLPRTVQKLMKGEAIHILVLGSSIDRGSGNPAFFAYDEDPESETFKQPLSRSDSLRIAFEPDLVGRPDLERYVGWHQHYDNYAGRLRNELMRKFNLEADKILINLMAADGSSAGETFTGIDAYCALEIPPDPFLTGGSAAVTNWRDIHPEIFERAEGPGPDLVIFGHGGNRRTDTPDEVAVYEGLVRRIQTRYPHTEFLFSMFQDAGGYTSNQGDLQALSLRYGIPMLDYGKASCDLVRWGNRYALVPPDGHPQAAAHYIWFKVIEQAFELWDPILPGAPQVRLPERVHQNTYGWEGDPRTFAREDPRTAGNLFVFEDTALNAWIEFKESPAAFVDGVPLNRRVISASRARSQRRPRLSSLTFGNARFGDRHILEIPADGARFNAVDAYVAPNRRFIGVESKVWERGFFRRTRPFESRVGAPYGNRQVRLPAGASMRVAVVGSDISVAYADDPGGGILRVVVNDDERLTIATAQPFTTRDGREIYLENRRGVTGLGYGRHDVVVEAVDGPVRVLGIFSYDRRSGTPARSMHEQ